MTAKTIRTSICTRWVRTASPVPATTSRRSNPGPPRGFTLIEILIVLAIIAMVVSVGLPAIERVTYQRINSTTRKFIGIIRTIKNDAILLNTIHRLVIDLDHQTWWVEQQKQFKLLSDEPEAEPQPKKGKGKQTATADPAPNFTPDEKFSKKPMPLPDGVAFGGVLKEREGLMKQGIAYVHFFPNGYGEEAILYLVKAGGKPDSFNGYSLIIRPVSGTVDIERSYVQRLP